MDGTWGVRAAHGGTGRSDVLLISGTPFVTAAAVDWGIKAATANGQTGPRTCESTALEVVEISQALVEAHMVETGCGATQERASASL
jgi:hypothetical protein